MGREVKRVPLDWEGWRAFEEYAARVNPWSSDEHRCPHCRRGQNRAAMLVERALQPLALTLSDGFRHPSLGGEDADTAAKLRELSAACGSSYGITTAGMLLCDLMEVLGLPVDWAYCSHCDGTGYPRDIMSQQEAWDKANPPPDIPAGDAYQLWSTTDGLPKTPPLATPEALAQHCVDNAVTVFGFDTATYDVWLALIRNGYTIGTAFVSGPHGTRELTREEIVARETSARREQE